MTDWLPLPEAGGIWLMVVFYSAGWLLSSCAITTWQRHGKNAFSPGLFSPSSPLDANTPLAYSAFKTSALAKLGGECLLAVWLVHGLLMLGLGVHQGYSLMWLLAFSAWLCGLLALLPVKNLHAFLRRLGAVLAAIILLLAMLWGMGSSALELATQAVLQQGKAPFAILSLHIVAAIGGTYLVMLAGVLALGYLWFDWRMKSKRPPFFLRGIFSLKNLEDWGNQALRWGFVSIAISVLLAFVFAKTSHWQQWFAWRRAAPLGALCIYAAVLFAYDIHLQRGAKLAVWRAVCTLVLGVVLSLEMWLLIQRGGE